MRSLGLRFIYGRAGSGKSSFCLKEIREEIESSSIKRPLFLIVPEQYSFIAEKNLLSSVGEMGLLNATVLSFKRLAFRVLSEAGGLARPHLNEAGKVMLINKILEDNRKDLEVFNRISKQQGFIKIIADTISEFKRYDIAPEQLIETAEFLPESKELKYKLKDLALIYNIYETKLHEIYIDAEDDLALLYEKLDESNMFKDAIIWFDEFTSFIPAQYKIIEKLLKESYRVNVALCTQRVTPKGEIELFDLVKNTEEKLLNLIKINNIAYEKPSDINTTTSIKFSDNKELSYLERNFFLYPYKPYKETISNISLFKSSNVYSEVEEVARNILSLVRDKGLRFRDIAVLSRNLENYDKLISVIFNEYGIPYFLDMKRDIEGNQLIVFIKAVIEIKLKNWSYESVFRFLKTGITGIPEEDIDILENYVLANGIKGWEWEEKFQYSFQGDLKVDINPVEKECLEKVNETRKLLNQMLKPFLTKLEVAKKVKDIATYLYSFLEEIDMENRLISISDSFRLKGLIDESEEYQDIWNILIRLLDQLVEVLGDEDITLDKFSKLFSTGLKEYKMGLIPSSLDQVQIGNVERVKSHEILHLFVIGVNDGVFPKTDEDQGIISDLDRNELMELGLELAKDSLERAYEEQFLVYSTFAIPKDKIYLSYPMADLEGKSIRASLVISKLKKLFPRLIEGNDRELTRPRELALLTSPEATLKELLLALRNELEGITQNNLWWEVLSWYRSDPKWKEYSESAFKGLFYDNTPVVSSEKINELYKKPYKFSVSRIQSYVECPFSYYVKYGLNTAERKIHQLTYPDIGSLMHNVLDDFSRTIEQEKIDWKNLDDKWCKGAIDILVEKKAKELKIFNSSERFKYYKERLKKILNRSIWAIATQVKAGNFKPFGHETAFNTGAAFPPIQLVLPSGDTVELIGRIDRIDELEDEGENIYVRIVDYKSGNKSFKLSDVYYGLQFQLLVYLDVILSNQEELKDKKYLPGAIFYFNIEDPLVETSKELTKEEIEDNILKKLKLKGLLLEDARVVKEMDKGINGYSLIIPARINKDGSLGSSSTASLSQFEMLRTYVRSSILEFVREMLEGNISIRPYKKKDYTACSYCNYAAICRFDPGIKGNNYRILKDLSDEKVWELIKDDR